MSLNHPSLPLPTLTAAAIIMTFACQQQDGNRSNSDARADSATATPAGGVLMFESGVSFAVPEDAVQSATAITLAPISAEEQAKILDSPLLKGRDGLRFVGGFAATPDGLRFARPIEATIPVLALGVKEFAVAVARDSEGDQYRVLATSLTYDAAKGVITVPLAHFSSATVLAVPLKGVAQHSCPPCVGGDCECCKELGFKVRVDQQDLGSGECQYVSSRIWISYPFCAGVPDFADQMTGRTCEDLELTMSIEPADPTLPLGEKVTLEATLRGERAGRPEFGAQRVDPVWQSDAPEVIAVDPDTGTLRGLQTTLAPVLIRARLGGDDDVSAETSVTVACPGCRLDVTPRALVLKAGDPATLGASVRNGDREVMIQPQFVSWGLDDSALLTVAPDRGTSTEVVGLRSGRGKVSATYRDQGMELSAYAPVRVGCPGCRLRLNAQPEAVVFLKDAKVTQDETSVITASFQDDEGVSMPLDENVLAWSQSQPELLGLERLNAGAVQVHATGVGVATVSVSYEDVDPPLKANVEIEICRLIRYGSNDGSFYACSVVADRCPTWGADAPYKRRCTQEGFTTELLCCPRSL